MRSEYVSCIQGNVMQAAVLLCCLIAALIGGAGSASAQSVTIAPTPIISGTLPTNSTYQVDLSNDGNTWNPTGILVAGSGAAASVRLDGLPANANYRLSSVGGSTTITPAVSRGLHLGASFPGAGEVRIQSREELVTGAWSHYGFAFSPFQNGFISAIRPVSASNAFFRAVQPVAPLPAATIASYPANPNSTYAGYGLVADDMPQLYQDGFIAAPCPAFYHRDGVNAAAAGECYELAGPLGRATVMVADTAETSPEGTCGVDRLFVDLGFPSFTNLVNDDSGFAAVTYRLVPAPVVGNIKVVCVINSGGYYVELRPYNHRAGLSKLEVQGPGGSWTELPRTSYNSFVYTSGTPLVTPFNMRVTSRFGEVVTFPAIQSMTDGSRLTANGQFNVFPDQGPAPVWAISPVYVDGFTNILSAQWGAFTYGGPVLDPNYASSVYQGSRCLRVTDFSGFGGITFAAPVSFPKQMDAFLEFAIRSEGAAIQGLKVQFEGFTGPGATAESSAGGIADDR